MTECSLVDPCGGDLDANELLVSIVMPAYNASKTVAKSIMSVQGQSYQNWELLIVDDCSTDDTGLVISGFSTNDGRIRLIPLSENSGGPAYPRNAAIKEAAGEFIAFLDADDEWLPEKLARQVTFMTRSNFALSCTGYDVVSFEGAEVGSFSPPKICAYNDLLAANSIGCLTAMYDVRVLGKQYFPICGHEDYALWLRILRNGYSVHGLQESLARYRLTRGSVSSSKLNVMKFFWNIYRNQEGLSTFLAIFYCARYAWGARRKYGKRSSLQISGSQRES